MNGTRICSVDGCTRAYRSSGMCVMHVKKAREEGTLKDLRFSANRPKLESVQCRIDGCVRDSYYRGKRLCMAHYLRIWKYGTVELPQPPTVRERLETERMVSDSGCWEWQGATASTGYGVVGHNGYVHRLAYETYVGPIPDGYQVDHLCFNRKCYNPKHLEAVTQDENLRRQRERMRRDEKNGRFLKRAMA